MKFSTIPGMLRRISITILTTTLLLVGCTTEAPVSGTGGARSTSSGGGTPSTAAAQNGAWASLKHLSRLNEARRLPKPSLKQLIGAPKALVAPPVAGEGDPCVSCAYAMAGWTDPLCSQASVDLFEAVDACACANGGACAPECTPTVEENFCDGNGVNAATSCKVCLVTPDTATPPGCFDSFYACLDDTVPPGPPQPCSEVYPGLPVESPSYTPPPPCDETILVNCISDGNLICDDGFEWTSACSADDVDVLSVCTPIAP